MPTKAAIDTANSATAAIAESGSELERFAQALAMWPQDVVCRPGDDGRAIWIPAGAEGVVAMTTRELAERLGVSSG